MDAVARRAGIDRAQGEVLAMADEPGARTVTEPRPDEGDQDPSPPDIDLTDGERRRGERATSLEALLFRDRDGGSGAGQRPSIVARGRDLLADVPAKQLIGGAVLCVVGIGLLAGWVLHVSWTPLIDLALVGIGALLVLQAWRGVPARPILVLGVVLAILSAATWRAGTSFDGGLGRRTIRVTQARPATYRLGTGQLTLDLRRAAVTKPVTIRARVGVGRIVVRVAGNQPVVTRTVAGAGLTGVLGKKHVGPGVEDVRRTPNPFGKTPITLDLRVGVGDVEVRHG
ncbi:MAG: PspC protein [Acidimicrobiales bacterium]|nr:PspC protein [Acidimicrobiales bacterium]